MHPRLTSNLTSNPATSNLTRAASATSRAARGSSPSRRAPARAHGKIHKKNYDDDDDEDDVSYARPVAARSSIAWTFDETRATMQELRRQLQIEKEVSRDAECQRDELARELKWSLRAERRLLEARCSRRSEAQRDAAGARGVGRPRAARRARTRLGKASQEFAAIDADLAAREREIEQNAERVKLEADRARRRGGARQGRGRTVGVARRRRQGYGARGAAREGQDHVGPRGEDPEGRFQERAR